MTNSTNNPAILQAAQARCVHAMRNGEELTPELLGAALVHALEAQKSIAAEVLADGFDEATTREIWEAARK